MSTRKTTTKPKTKAAGTKSSAAKATHPPFADMIAECITQHPEDARSGVSRPQIKKYLETKYKLEITPTISNQINKAIVRGEETGRFVLPKGVSGKVKLASKAKADTQKENQPTAKPASKATAAKPAAKKASTTKAAPKKATTKKAPAAKKAPAKKTAAPKKAAAGTTKRAAPKPRTTANSTGRKAARSSPRKATTKK